MLLPLIQAFFFESLAVLAVLLAGPALMVWASRDWANPRRAAIHAGLALLFGAPGLVMLATVREGQGVLGLMLAAGGLLLVGLAAAFVSAALTRGLLMLMPTRRPAVTARDRYGHVPDTATYREWQRESGQPGASYEEFLREAHPRKFPASTVSIVVAVLAMVAVFALLIRR